VIAMRKHLGWRARDPEWYATSATTHTGGLAHAKTIPDEGLSGLANKWRIRDAIRVSHHIDGRIQALDGNASEGVRQRFGFATPAGFYRRELLADPPGIGERSRFWSRCGSRSNDRRP
jgi:hypothetical protein